MSVRVGGFSRGCERAHAVRVFRTAVRCVESIPPCSYVRRILRVYYVYSSRFLHATQPTHKHIHTETDCESESTLSLIPPLFNVQPQVECGCFGGESERTQNKRRTVPKIPEVAARKERTVRSLSRAHKALKGGTRSARESDTRECVSRVSATHCEQRAHNTKGYNKVNQRTTD